MARRLKANEVRDLKTGRIRKKDLVRSKRAKKAWKTRSRKTHTPATKAKISKTMKKVWKTCRITRGNKRRALFPKCRKRGKNKVGK